MILEIFSISFRCPRSSLYVCLISCVEFWIIQTMLILSFSVSPEQIKKVQQKVNKGWNLWMGLCSLWLFASQSRDLKQQSSLAGQLRCGQTTSYKLQATSYKLQTTSYKLQATSCKLQTKKISCNPDFYPAQIKQTACKKVPTAIDIDQNVCWTKKLICSQSLESKTLMTISFLGIILLARDFQMGLLTG